MKHPRIRVCEKCYVVSLAKYKQCSRCGHEHQIKRRTQVKWTKKTEQKMLAIISKHKKLQDGFIDAADKLNTSKSAIANRYYKVMKAAHVDPTGDEEPTSYPWDNRIINPPISCEAGAVNYINEPKIEKPKSFIEKVKAFLKGGKDE